MTAGWAFLFFCLLLLPAEAFLVLFAEMLFSMSLYKTEKSSTVMLDALKETLNAENGSGSGGPEGVPYRKDERLWRSRGGPL